MDDKQFTFEGTVLSNIADVSPVHKDYEKYLIIATTISGSPFRFTYDTQEEAKEARCELIRRIEHIESLKFKGLRSDTQGDNDELLTFSSIPISKIARIYDVYTERDNSHRLSLQLDNGNECHFTYRSLEAAEEGKRELVRKLRHVENLKLSTHKLVQHPKDDRSKGMLDSIKRYYKEHEDVLFPLIIAIVLDHFFNDGALRTKIIKLVQGLLDGIQQKLLPAPPEDKSK